MVEGHGMSVWREPNVPDVGWGKIWAHCACGYECFATNYEDLAMLTAEHYEEALALHDLDAEEAAR